MSLITNKNTELPESGNNGQIGNVKPVDQVDAMQADKFSDLVDKDQQKATMENEVDEAAITPEELQRQIRDSMFRNGFTRSIEKAREISDELKKG